MNIKLNNSKYRNNMNGLSTLHTWLMWQLLHNSEPCQYFKEYARFNPSSMDIACRNWIESELIHKNSLELISILQYSPGFKGLEYILLFVVIGIPLIILWIYWKVIKTLVWHCNILYNESVQRNENMFMTSLRGKHYCVLWGMIPLLLPIWITYQII